jgi:hypothetical protein
MDIDALRQSQIEMHGLTRADEIYTFYHDETNNVRKLELKSGGFNVAALSVFVLGGVVHGGSPRPLDIAGLRDAMRIQKSAPELKLGHVGKGDFLTVLGSPKLTHFLRWLSANDLLLHYHELDPLYWSIVDVVDAIVQHPTSPVPDMFASELKADLTEVLRSDLGMAANLFHRFGYPSVMPGEQRAFLDGLLELLEQSEGLLEHFRHYMLKGILQAGRKIGPLDFGVEPVPRLLIDNFSGFYLNRLAVFKNATHVLDMEPSIQARLCETPLTSGGAPATHFRFVDSRAEAGIQLSDVVAGLIGKMHTYFTQASSEEVELARDELRDHALENTILLRDVINSSHSVNIAFLHHVASRHDVEKVDLFLRFPRESDHAYKPNC